MTLEDFGHEAAVRSESFVWMCAVYPTVSIAKVVSFGNYHGSEMSKER